MKDYYGQLKKIEDFDSFDRSELLTYIHRQKCEVSALLNIDVKFWAELDYLIHLTRSYLGSGDEEKRVFFIKNVYPIIQRKAVEIKKVTDLVPDTEFFYLKKDMKLFCSMIFHTLNLVGKNLPYFIPGTLFAASINNMTVLYPLLDRSCDAGALARNNYAVLLTRYVARDFSQQLVDIIDYMIWVNAVFRTATEQDQRYFREQIIRKISDFTDKELLFNDTAEFSTKAFVAELHEVLTSINIKSSMEQLLNTIMNEGISVPDCLRSIASIFLDVDKVSGQTTVYRDLSIASELASSIIADINSGNNKTLRSSIMLAKALKPYFMQVSRYMIDMHNDMEICRLFEIADYIDATLPSFIMHDDIVPILEKSIEAFEAQKELIKQTVSISFDKEAAELFKAKALQIYAGKQ